MPASSRELRRARSASTSPTYTQSAASDLLTNLRAAALRSDVDRDDVRRLAGYFDRFAKDALSDAGYEASNANVSSVLGETLAHYNDVLRGREGSLARVMAWVLRWQLVFLPATDFAMATCDLVLEPLLPSKKGGKKGAKTPEPPAISAQKAAELAGRGIRLLGTATTTAQAASAAGEGGTP